MLKPSKLLRSRWPKVRPERKNGSVGYLVDARGNGWTGKTRFFFQKKDEALRKAKELANDYRELGEKGAKFKHENFSLLLSLNLQLKQTREKFEAVFGAWHGRKYCLMTPCCITSSPFLISRAFNSRWMAWVQQGVIRQYFLSCHLANAGSNF